MDKKRKFIIISPNYSYSIILGDLYQNNKHKHFSIHLALSLKSDIKFFIKENMQTSSYPIVIAPNISHRIVYTEGNPLMIMSISPLSNMGLYLKNRLKNREFIQLKKVHLTDALRFSGNDLYNGKISKEVLLSKVDETLNKVIPYSAENSLVHLNPRIIKALEIIYKNFEEVIPARTIAGMVNLSTSRFLHLFKEEMGITYRRMQIWMKLGLSFKLYPKSSSLTDLALNCGFADSAHYSREFKITFGVSPSTLLKNSQFIQE